MNISDKKKIEYMNMVESFLEGICDLYQDEHLSLESSEYNSNINFSALGGKYFMETGASKMVLIPHDEKEEYVIKIPFTGTSYKNETSIEDCCGIWANAKKRQGCHCEGWLFKCPYSEELCEHFSRPDEDEEEKEEYGYADFEGARNGWDYCADEVDIYLAAKEEGLEKFFAEAEHIGTTKGGIPIYLQKKISHSSEDNYDSEKGRAITKKSVSQYKKYSCSPTAHYFLNTTFAEVVIEYYGIGEFVKLMNFMAELDLSDFHSENVGYDEEFRPVIFDYSGFND